MANRSLPNASLAGFDSFISSVNTAFVAATASSAAPALSATSLTPGDPPYDLRTRLAVRGWVNPRALLDTSLSEDAATATLNAVADEADAAFALKPGAWFLSVAARRRVLAMRGVDTLRRELDVVRIPNDATDPVRLALRFALSSDPLPPLETIDTEVLRGLAVAFDWFDGDPPVGVGRPSLAAEIAAALAARVQSRDLARLTDRKMVGHGHLAARESVVRWLAEPLGKGLSCQYLYGSGGVGKSTVLAFIESDIRNARSAPALARIDFDDPLVNATEPTSLDIALLGQLEERYPGLVSGAGNRIAQLRRMQRYQKAEVLVASGNLRRRRVMREAQVESLELEGAHSSARSERISMLYGALDFNRPLAIILDTAELVVTQGETAMVELTGWVRSLTEGLGAVDVRLVIAGRDSPGPPGCGDLIDRLAQFVPLRETIELHDLDVAEATRLLIDCGVGDPEVARAAAKAVPGNPLLLRITADALLQSPKLADEVRAAHGNASVDAVSANNYLARRIVAHLADPVGRPYLLAAAYLPLVYRAVLRDVLIPLVDGTPGRPADLRSTDRVFRALRGAAWLTRASADGRSLRFQRDVRALMLELLASDPAQRDLATQLHNRAAIFHAERRGTRDRAFALYHRAMLGDAPAGPRINAAIAGQLTEVIDDFTPEWRAALRAPSSDAPPRLRNPSNEAAVRAGPSSSASATRGRSDEDWRLYLEGVGTKGGEGDRLLDRDRPEEALALYRDRPTQPRGTPPTFVIRALADIGDWDSDDINADAILAESSAWEKAKRLNPAALSRLYWITRLMLLRDDARLPPRHLETLRRVCRLLTGEGLTTMPAIIAVAEAGAKTVILPESVLIRVRAIQTVMRVCLARAVVQGQPFALTLPVEDIVVAQLDWYNALGTSAQQMFDVPRLYWVHKKLEALNDRPIAEFNAQLREWKLTVKFGWDGKDLIPAILALRGQTTEFLRPLRQALVNLHDQDHDNFLLHVLMPVIERMSLLPVEFSSGRLAEALKQDSRAWCAAFVGFADRARLLPLLCRILLDVPDKSPATATQRAKRVARSFLIWDEALCGGLPSEWPARN